MGKQDLILKKKKKNKGAVGAKFTTTHKSNRNLQKL